MRQARLPVCGQNPHAAVRPSDSPLPRLSWLSFYSETSYAYGKGVDAIASVSAPLCDSSGGCLPSVQGSPYNRTRNPYRSPPLFLIVGGRSVSVPLRPHAWCSHQPTAHTLNPSS